MNFWIAQRSKKTPSHRCFNAMVLAIALCAMTVAGCGKSAKEYARYGEAGTTYAIAMDQLLLIARDRFIDAQSEELLQDREIAYDATNYATRDEMAREYIQVIADLRQHTQLTARYFRLVQRLATSDAPDRFSEAAKGTALSLNDVGTSLRNRPFLSDARVGAVGTLSKIAVSGKIRRNLRKELVERQDTIRRELLTQERLLNTLSIRLQTHLAEINQRQKERYVDAPYRSGDATKPGNQDRWMVHRRMALTAPGTVDQLLEAGQAVTELREVYEELLTGKVDIASVNNLITDLETLLSAVESIKTLSHTPAPAASPGGAP